jgi:ornithine cyclodeaminase
MPVLLTEKDVRDVVSMDDLIAAMETALDRYSGGSVRQPLRSVVDVASRHAFFGVMPAFIDGSAPALGTKLVSVYHSNLAQGLPSHLATIVLFDPDTGALRALVDGRYITEARTAAASAASTRHLAREDARVLAVFGSGVQARSHIDALVRVRPIDEIRIWGRDAAHVDRLIDELVPRVRARMTRAAGAREAARDADVIALVTASPEPVLFREWVKDGTHICAVGACRPNQREMDTALVKAARVFVDSRVGALAEAGDIVIPIKERAIDESHIVAEIGDVCGGRVVGRRSASEITLFKSLGMAVEDVAAAHLAFERASERGLGRGFVL